MKNTILQLLGFDEVQYEYMYGNAYLRWAESCSVSQQNLQSILANASVNKWYNAEYHKCETKFLDFVKNYKNQTQKDILLLYNDCTFSVYSRSCPALMKEAIKNNKIYAKE